MQVSVHLRSFDIQIRILVFLYTSELKQNPGCRKPYLGWVDQEGTVWGYRGELRRNKSDRGWWTCGIHYHRGFFYEIYPSSLAREDRQASGFCKWHQREWGESRNGYWSGWSAMTILVWGHNMLFSPIGRRECFGFACMCNGRQHPDCFILRNDQ